ncbi:hypothetical protein [Sphingomonas sp. BK580]|uniref:hypothetical protein n=1 Tax=Sphingomonas sp. BK580 TaxID=2586972 RepID=UPI00161E6429|nr:hypothetical protein [Sphingomonas sp. BK580]MBB3691424.1 hypothetical protein [Sphingomonas sp. BK580]
MFDDDDEPAGDFERALEVENDPQRAGADDPGEDDADRDICGKAQDELTADELRGDTREHR